MNLFSNLKNVSTCFYRLNSSLSYQNYIKKININLNIINGNKRQKSIPYEVEYVDTRTDHNDKMKVVVAVHGVPGYYDHFKKLIDYSLKNQHFRIIAPNLPDFALTRKTFSFWHSPSERAQFLRDFLKAINVNTIDCLACHSAGLHPTLLICSEQQQFNIKSLALFCPQPLWLKPHYFAMNKPFALLSQNSFGIKLFEILKPHLIANKFGYSMVYKDLNEFLLAANILSNNEENKLNASLKWLKESKTPTIFVYGQRDSLIPKQTFDRLLNDLGANQNSFKYYDSKGSLEKHQANEDWIKVLVFRSGGHFAYLNFSKIVNEEVNNVIQKL